MRETSDGEIPVAMPIADTRPIDSAGGRAVHVRLHHHRVQGLIDAPARFEDLREEAALAQLRDPVLEIASIGRQPEGAENASRRSRGVSRR